MRIGYRTAAQMAEESQAHTPARFDAPSTVITEAHAIPMTYYYDPELGSIHPDGPVPRVTLYLEGDAGALFLYLHPDDARKLARLADEAEAEAGARSSRVRAAV
jgi:hypothetical protein